MVVSQNLSEGVEGENIIYIKVLSKMIHIICIHNQSQANYLAKN